MRGTDRSFIIEMLSVAHRLVLKTCQQRALSLSAIRKETKTSNIGEYRVVDHVYDSVVVGAGWLPFLSYNTHIKCSLCSSKNM